MKLVRLGTAVIVSMSALYCKGLFPEAQSFFVGGPAGEEERLGIYNIVTRLHCLGFRA